MNKIILHDGTEINDGLAVGVNNNQLFVSIPGTNIVEAASTFGDPNKTQVIICYSGIYKFTFNGYIRINSIAIDTYENKTQLYLTGDNISSDTEYTVPEEYLPEEMRSNTEEVNEDV